jgi:hypothetical protein
MTAAKPGYAEFWLPGTRLPAHLTPCRHCALPAGGTLAMLKGCRLHPRRWPAMRSANANGSRRRRGIGIVTGALLIIVTVDR